MNSRATHSRYSGQKQEEELLRLCRSKVRYLSPIILYTLLYVFFNCIQHLDNNNRLKKVNVIRITGIKI